MGRILSFALAVLVCGAAGAADLDLSIDERISDTGLRLGRARAGVSQSIGEVFSLKVDASAYADGDKNPVDLTEAFVEYRPYPIAGFKARVKAGAFYAPISLENRAAGWESPYTVSSSALNTWVAEELRTIGLETTVDWLGTRLGHSFDLGATAGVFGWNDDAGVLISSHGFRLNDRQTTLFGRNDGHELFHEIDGKAGYYYGVEARYLDRVTFRALHYDNRADAEKYSAAANDYAWNTRFDSAGVRVELPQGWGVIAQWMDGETYIEPNEAYYETPFNARFWLVSKHFGTSTISLRRDDFSGGHAWTSAYAFEPNERWRLIAEYLHVDDDRFQLAVRYAIKTTTTAVNKPARTARHDLSKMNMGAW